MAIMGALYSKLYFFILPPMLASIMPDKVGFSFHC